jgi:3-hydroxyisobutyrate dehydrogenase-like beta-hydroxyacid dehydrogenase
MVLDDAQVRDVVAEILTSAPAGTIIAIHSTIRPQTAEELAVIAAARDVDVIDAPVSGGFIGAHRGDLAVMVGGERRAYEACKEPFSAWAGLIMHFGPAGAGTRAKLARNLLHFIAFTAAGEAQALADAAGLDLGKLARIVRHSDGVIGGPGAIMVRSTTAPLEPGDEWHDVMQHTRSLGEKDLALALELARDLGVELPLGTVALERFAASLGLAPRDPP